MRRLIWLFLLLTGVSCAKQRTDREWCKITNFADDECMRAGHKAMKNGEKEVAKSMFARACAAGLQEGCWIIYQETKPGGRLPTDTTGRGNLSIMLSTCAVGWTPICTKLEQTLWITRHDNPDHRSLLDARCAAANDETCERYLRAVYEAMPQRPAMRRPLYIRATDLCERGLLSGCATVAQLDYDDDHVASARARSLDACQKRNTDGCRVYGLVVSAADEPAEVSRVVWALCDLGDKRACDVAKSEHPPRPATSLLNPLKDGRDNAPSGDDAPEPTPATPLDER